MTFIWYFLNERGPSITTEHFINLIAPVMDRAFLSVSAYVGEKVRERGIAPHKSSEGNTNEPFDHGPITTSTWLLHKWESVVRGKLDWEAQKSVAYSLSISSQ